MGGGGGGGGGENKKVGGKKNHPRMRYNLHTCPQMVQTLQLGRRDIILVWEQFQAKIM